ncbi:hypothetical protein J6590_037229 [Homalodisca vitripennis]|nr:hypothetical protein J6590_037229 [Homalodisca vitripennis]
MSSCGAMFCLILIISSTRVSGSPFAPLKDPPSGIDSDNHFRHLLRLADFSCHKPQPRVIPVSELLSPRQRHGKAYDPDVSVLHRCDFGTGCCLDGGFCEPSRVECVNLPFKVTFLEDLGAHKRGSWQIDFLHLVNHTECRCSSTRYHHALADVEELLHEQPETSRSWTAHLWPEV